MGRIIQIAIAPRASTTKRQFDAVYVLTATGEVWRADLQQGAERTIEWTKLPDLPPEATAG